MFKVYSSSAGSGKTYTLTKEYLKLSLSNETPTYFRHILAVTFTNAAANEMKDRILTMLRVFSLEKKEGEEPHFMLADIVRELYPQTIEDQALFHEACQLISARAKTTFGQILHRYSDFSVMTIDKFTQRLVSSFTDELGIPFVFETKLDSDLLDDAVDRLLARIGEEGEEVLTNIVERYYRENAEEGKSWGALPHQIKVTAQALLNETAYIRMKQVAGLRMEDWVKIRQQMRDFVAEKEKTLTTLASHALDRIQTTFLTEKEFFQSGRGIYGFFRDRSEGKKLWAEPNAYVLKTIGEDVWYGGKAPVPVKNEIDGIKTDLENYFHQIENTRLTETSKVTLYRLLDKYIYHLSLLGEIRKEFGILLKQNNQVHISDFNRKIGEIVANEPVPFIFEKLGDKYNHILVDEFQDTSKLQFANLLPLIENALSSGYFNLIVGDAKQSIYRFRGGDMDLIIHLAQNQVGKLASILGENFFHEERLNVLHQYLEVNHLRINRRSCREITDFNNKFFAFVAGQLGDEYPLVREVFDQHFQQEIPEATASGGHVEIEFLEPGNTNDDSSEDVPLADYMVGRTQELVLELKEKGYNWRDIAILCRRKVDAVAMASMFREAAIPLISDDALALTYSRPVHFLVSFMKVLLNSDHKLARYEAAYLFHHVIKGETPLPDDYERIRNLCEERGLESFLAYFRERNVQFTSLRLRQLSVFELTELLMQKFGLLERQLDSEYLFRFLDVVLDFGNRSSNHLGDFLDYWEKNRHRFSITVPEDTNALRITTIHKSKGLEYPVVIVPYAHWKVTPDARLGRLWVGLEEVDYPELGLGDSHVKRLNSSLLPINKELTNTVVADQFQAEKMRVLTESLNLLYVAFTRPVERLYVLTKREKAWESGIQVNNWMKDYLSQEHIVPAWSDDVSSYKISEGTRVAGHARRSQPPASFMLDHIISTDRTESLRLRRLADRIFDVATFEPRNDRLQKIRYVLTRLRSPQDLGSTLGKLVREGIFTKKESEKVGEAVGALIDNDIFQEIYNTNQRVQISKELLIPGGNLFHVDRVSEDSEHHLTFTSFATGSDYHEAKRHLKSLVQSYKEAGRDSTGILVNVKESKVERI